MSELLKINAQAQQQNKLAAITVPGIGTGQFAGVFAEDQSKGGIKAAFRNALENVLSKHQDKLKHIDIVHYDPYSGDKHQAKEIGHIKFDVSPSSTMKTTGQLAFPAGATAETHTLTSFVAWDHFSWPGNDFWPGARATDDGVKAASTNTMAVLTGSAGRYDAATGSYLPPMGYANWQQFAQHHKLQFNGPISVVKDNGQKYSITEVLLPVDANIPGNDYWLGVQHTDDGISAKDNSALDTFGKTAHQFEDDVIIDSSDFIPSMQILSGFIAAVGVAAVTTAVTLFSLGMIPGATAALVGTIGAAAMLTGFGLFKANAPIPLEKQLDLDDESILQIG